MANYIDVAVELRVITPSTGEMARGIKEFRNVIHPGRQLRKGLRAGQHELAVARAWLDALIDDLRR